MSYLLNFPSPSRDLKLMGYRRTQPSLPGSMRRPATQTVSPYVLDGCGAALTVMITRIRSG